jgi:hypothetical protein
MPQTVRTGSAGETVTYLQAQLNMLRPQPPALAVDGIFGPKTHQRVLEFQRAKSLAVDGVVGPKTWAALTAPQPIPAETSRGPTCATGSEASLAFATRLRGALMAAGAGGPAAGSPVGDSALGFVGGGGISGNLSAAAVSLAGLILKPLIGSRYEMPARARYAASLDYSRIYYTDIAGQSDRAFTVAAPVSVVPSIPGLPSGGHIQVINLGPSPKPSTVIHELCHVWQSQHHSVPEQYMANCVACQKRAEATNTVLGKFDSTLAANRDFPSDYPYSAYGYVPGGKLADYGGEQVAQMVENGEAAIVAHVTSKPPGVDADNERSLRLLHVVVQDMRAHGAKM